MRGSHPLRRLVALLVLLWPAVGAAQLPPLTITYHVEGCESGTGLLLQPVSVCGHVFQTVPGVPDLLQRFVVNVNLGSPVEDLRFGVGLQGVNIGFVASGATGSRFEMHLATTTLLGCARSGSLTFANPAQLSGDPRILGIVATQGPSFSSSDPFYIEGPLLAEIGPGASRTLRFDLDGCIPDQFALHVEGLNQLENLIGSFGNPAVLATITGLPGVIDLLYRDRPTDLLVDLSHNSETLAAVFAFPDSGNLIVAQAPKKIVAQANRDAFGDLSAVSLSFNNTPAGGATFQYDGSLLGEVSAITVGRITSGGVLADLAARKFSFGDAAFSGGPATFDRREGTLFVDSGGPGQSHEIDVDVTALSVFKASIEAPAGVTVILDHDGFLEATAALPDVGSFAIGKLRSAAFFVDSSIPAFVIEDAARTGGSARFKNRDGSMLVDLATTDGLRAHVEATAMDLLRALVDVEENVSLLVDHVGRINLDVEAPSLGRFDIVRLPSHLAGLVERDPQGDLSRLQVEASGGTFESRVTAATSVVGSVLEASLGALLNADLVLDRATDLVSLDIGYALGAGDLFLDLQGSTDGQSFDATANGIGMSSLSMSMSLDTAQGVDFSLDHVGRIDLDVDFPGLTQIVATKLPWHTAFEARRDSNGKLAVVDVVLTQGTAGSEIVASADLDDVDFFARIRDIGSGNILADLGANGIDIDLRYATPNGFIDVDGLGTFSGRDVRFSLNSVDLRRSRLVLANNPVSLGANGSRAGSFLSLDVGLSFIGIPLSFDAKVLRRGDGRYDLEFPLQIINGTETVTAEACRTKGIPQLFSQIDLQLCALNP